MMTDTEIRQKGMEWLSQGLGFVEAERFIALVQRQPFDDAQWRQREAPTFHAGGCMAPGSPGSRFLLNKK